ncbi:hypothetical protein EMCRGX_G034036 [Ephydatia muelleri]
MAFYDFPTLCPALFHQHEKKSTSVIDSEVLAEQQREYELWAKELKHSPFQAPLGLRRQDYDVAAAADRSIEVEESEADSQSDVEDSNGSLEGDDSEQMDDDASVQDFAMGQH